MDNGFIQAWSEATPEIKPKHLLRIGLGSYALNITNNLNNTDIEEIYHTKDEDPYRLAKIMRNQFLYFFKKYPPGCPFFITMPPRSLRNIKNPHPVDWVCIKLTEDLDCEYVTFFEPWNKPGRGKQYHDYSEEMILHPSSALIKYRSVVYVLDDVMTTGNTLKRAVNTLTNRGYHAHGIVFLAVK